MVSCVSLCSDSRGVVGFADCVGLVGDVGFVGVVGFAGVGSFCQFKWVVGVLWFCWFVDCLDVVVFGGLTVLLVLV